MSVTITGMKTVRANLKKAGEGGRKAVKAEVTRAAVNIHGEARRNAPTNTGRYRSSIAWQYETSDGLNAIVGTNNLVGKFLEFGTGPAGKDSRHSLLAQQAMAEIGYVHGPRGGLPPLEVIERWCHLKGIPVDEAPAIRWAIRTNGSPARPHLFPAIEAESKVYPARIRRALRQAVRDASQ